MLVRILAGLGLVGLGLVGSVPDAMAQTSRYTASSGTVHDNKTGLTWQQASPATTYTQTAAASYCQGMGTGWRLPGIKELQSIMDFTVASPGPMFNSVFSGTASWYWSSTPFAGSPSTAWTVNFNTGNTLNDDVTVTHNARCVH